MKSLIFSVFRAKLKITMTFIIYILLFILLIVSMSDYQKNNKKIEELQNDVKNIRISVLVNNNDLLSQIKKIPYIVKIEDKEITNDFYNLLIQIDSKENITNTINDLKKIGLRPTVYSTASSETEIYKEAEQFYKMFILIILTCIFIMIIVETILHSMWEENNIIFLKVLGYSNWLILIIILFRIYIPIIISFIISIFIGICIFYVVSISFNLNIIILLIMLLLLVIIIQMPLLLYRIKKISFVNI